MQNLKVAIIQSKIIWENPELNFELFGKKINSMKEEIDLIILPETFSTGFTMNVHKLSDIPDGKTAEFLRTLAKQKKSFIAGSAIIKDKNKYYNRLLISSSDGEIFHYDKRHLFRMGREHEVYSPGNKQLILKIKKWRVAFFVCYDLRFPVWSRNNNSYDISVFVANWPEIRQNHWNALLLARAIENQSYVIGVNRIGIDGNGIISSGDSVVINPWGEYILNAKRKDGIFTADLSHKILTDYKKKFPAYKDTDKFSIKT